MAKKAEKNITVRILMIGDGRERSVAVNQAPSLLAGLEKHWLYTLSAYGYTDPTFDKKTNTLACLDLQGIPLTYKAVKA